MIAEDLKNYDKDIHYIFVINENVIKYDLDYLPAKLNFHLICSSRCYEGMSMNNINRFNTIHVPFHLNSQSIVDIINNQIKVDERLQIKIISNDECAEVICAEVCAKLGLGDYEFDKAYLMSDKTVMKRRLLENGIKCPKFLLVKDILKGKLNWKYLTELLGSPFVVKPVNSTSSSGVRVLSSEKDLNDWLESHSKEWEYEFEEYIEGVLYTCDSIIKDNQIIYFNCGAGNAPCLDYVLGKNVGVRFVEHESVEYKVLKELNRRVLDILKPMNGASHMEAFMTLNGEVVFLELSARPGGADIMWMYEQYDGVNLEKAHFELRMGIDFQCKKDFNTQSMYAAFCYFPPRVGVVNQLTQFDFKCDWKLKWNIRNGDVLPAPSSLAIRNAGSVQLKSCDYEVLKQEFNKLCSSVPFTVCEVNNA